MPSTWPSGTADPRLGWSITPTRAAQYTSLAFGRRLRDSGIVASMGSVGDCYDNAVTESFFATLECEVLDRSRFATRTQARTAVFDYLEGSTTGSAATPPWATSAPPTTRGGTPPAPLPPDPASPTVSTGPGQLHTAAQSTVATGTHHHLLFDLEGRCRSRRMGRRWCGRVGCAFGLGRMVAP
jgi:transposase InsO family protein